MDVRVPSQHHPGTLIVRGSCLEIIHAKKKDKKRCTQTTWSLANLTRGLGKGFQRSQLTVNRSYLPIKSHSPMHLTLGRLAWPWYNILLMFIARFRHCGGRGCPQLYALLDIALFSIVHSANSTSRESVGFASKLTESLHRLRDAFLQGESCHFFSRGVEGVGG